MTITSKLWRLNNLYRIIHKNGTSIPFKLNPVQELVVKCHHNRKLILKARQLGMSTLSVISLLDDVLFTPTLSAGIVSYSLEHAQHIFKRIIGHALDTFPEELKRFIGIKTRSAREISFSNGSYLRVDTTLRGSTYQNILVSEFGKTCARTPYKADEVIAGTLNTVPIDGFVTIESTGEGMDGYFADMCLTASNRGNENLSVLDYHLLFFPWYSEKNYKISDNVDYDVYLSDYFEEIEKESGLVLEKEQRNWYALQAKVLGDKLKQEFPSTVKEAFLSKSDAYYYAQGVELAYKDNRCLFSNIYDPMEKVYVCMDIGVNDLTVILFYQHIHGEIRIFDMYADSNKDVDFYAKHLLQDKDYLYHTIFLPHDSVKRDPLDVINSVERTFKKLFSRSGALFKTLSRTDKQELISYSKIKLNRCVFDLRRCNDLIKNLSKYRKTWQEQQGRYIDKPLHTVESNYADAFQYLCQSIGIIEKGFSINNAFEMHKLAVENRRKMI